MKNAYKILGVAQNADTIEIVNGQKNAMRERKYSSTEIAIAKKQLSTPALRLAVDFIYPIVDKPFIQQITSTTQHTDIDIKKIDCDAFNSLK